MAVVQGDKKLFNWQISPQVYDPSFSPIMGKQKICPVDDYDVQIYLEDDIHFKQENLDYWLKYKRVTLSNDYNLGFLRIEKDTDGKELMTDVNWPIEEVIQVEGQNFLINDLNPYCGFWIYDKKELRNFIKSKEWKFKFDGYGIRAKAAVGWHGKNMKRYKETIIPVIKEGGKLITPSGAAVHHMPNNYIGKGKYCTREFPIEIKESKIGSKAQR